MDPYLFVHFMVGNFDVKIPIVAKLVGSAVHPLSSPRFCTNFVKWIGDGKKFFRVQKARDFLFSE